MSLPKIQLLPAIAVLAMTPLGPVTAHAAGPGPSKPKQSYALRIGIDNGRTNVRTGDRLTYVTKVSNTGTAKTPDLLLTQTLLPGIKLLSSAPKGTLSQGRITWNQSLPTGKTNEFRVTVEVGRLQSRPKRLAAVACASTKTAKRPIVCASHLDLLDGTATTAPKGRLGGPALIWGIGSAIVAAGALAVALPTLLRRRRKRLGDG
jgi:uncharacterized repeat protein (TIGR01451 family)